MQSCCADDVRMTYVVLQWNLARSLTMVSSVRHPHIIRTSSAHHPQVVHTRFQPQKYFQLNSRATALLIREDDIKNHNAPIEKSLQSYKLFQWGNLVMCKVIKCHVIFLSWDLLSSRAMSIHVMKCHVNVLSCNTVKCHVNEMSCYVMTLHPMSNVMKCYFI